MNNILYFDESGFTGADLLCPQQPYFCLASVLFTDDELDIIKKDIGADKYGKELHFKNLHTNWEGRKILKKLFAHPLLDKSHIITGIALKRYCVYAQIVDILIETYFFEKGYNLYKGKQNVNLANALYCFAVSHNNKTMVREFEEAFVSMIRSPKTDLCRAFFLKLDKLIKSEDTCNQFKDLLFLIVLSKETLGDALVTDDPFYLDNTTSMFFAIIQKWYKRTEQEFNIFFDDSKPIKKHLTLLEGLRDIKKSKTIVGYDTRKHILPLPMGTIKLVDSKDYFGIQIADIIASTFVFILTNTNNKLKKIQEELKNMSIFQETDVPLLPSKIEKENHIINTEEEELDPLDFICNHLSNPD